MNSDFLNILEKYKNNTATNEEIKIVESEIEKNKAINEYLADTFDEHFLPLDNETDCYAEDDINDNIKEIENVKKTMNSKFRKIIVSSVAIVLAVLMLVFYVVSPLVGKMYYNPSLVSQGEHHKDLYFDMRVFTELSIPGYAYVNGMAGDLGFGKYDIYMVQKNLFTKVNENSIGHIIRGKRIGMYEDFFMRSFYFYNDFGSSRQMEADIEEFTDMTYKRTINDLKTTSKTAYASLFVSFENDISLESFELMRRDYLSYSQGGLDFKWVGIRIDNESQINDQRIGFNPNLNDGSTTSDRPDPEKYPYLSLIDYMDDSILMEKFGTYEGYLANGYEIHFKSMLKYLINSPEFTQMLFYSKSKTEDYQNALNYVEENGVNTYGALVYGTVEELLVFIENENINNVLIDDIKVSKYSR